MKKVIKCLLKKPTLQTNTESCNLRNTETTEQNLCQNTDPLVEQQSTTLNIGNPKKIARKSTTLNYSSFLPPKQSDQVNSEEETQKAYDRVQESNEAVVLEEKTTLQEENIKVTENIKKDEVFNIPKEQENINDNINVSDYVELEEDGEDDDDDEDELEEMEYEDKIEEENIQKEIRRVVQINSEKDECLVIYHETTEENVAQVQKCSLQEVKTKGRKAYIEFLERELLKEIIEEHGSENVQQVDLVLQIREEIEGKKLRNNSQCSSLSQNSQQNDIKDHEDISQTAEGAHSQNSRTHPKREEGEGKDHNNKDLNEHNYNSKGNLEQISSKDRKSQEEEINQHLVKKRFISSKGDCIVNEVETENNIDNNKCDQRQLNGKNNTGKESAIETEENEEEEEQIRQEELTQERIQKQNKLFFYQAPSSQQQSQENKYDGRYGYEFQVDEADSPPKIQTQERELIQDNQQIEQENEGQDDAFDEAKIDKITCNSKLFANDLNDSITHPVTKLKPNEQQLSQDKVDNLNHSHQSKKIIKTKKNIASRRGDFPSVKCAKKNCSSSQRILSPKGARKSANLLFKNNEDHSNNSGEEYQQQQSRQLAGSNGNSSQMIDEYQVIDDDEDNQALEEEQKLRNE